MIRLYELKNGELFQVDPSSSCGKDLCGKTLEKAGDKGGVVLCTETQDSFTLPTMTVVKLVKPPSQKGSSKKKSPKRRIASNAIIIDEAVHPARTKDEVVEELLQEEEKDPMEDLLGGNSD